MEPLGAFLDEEWESLRRLFSTEEADFMVQLHGLDEHDEGLSFGTSSSTFWPTDDHEAHIMAGLDQTLFSYSDTLNSNFQYFYQENSNSSGSNGVFFPTPSHENSDDHIPVTNKINTESMDFCVMNNKINNSSTVPVFSYDVMEDVVCLKEEMSSDQLGNVGQPAADDAGPAKEVQLKRKSGVPEPAKTSENPKKKSRVSRNVQKSTKNAQTKKNHKQTLNDKDEEENNAGPNGQSSSCYSSEDDSNASQELNGGATSDSKGSAALNSNGKTRAGRGAATDPQSLYARKRRERINERLRILQNLVPNGTKVDISTMLEEAVHYVKFLQLQIKEGLSANTEWDVLHLKRETACSRGYPVPTQTCQDRRGESILNDAWNGLFWHYLRNSEE
ncbi:hypothetical protein F0562_027575 [Nyssa sinensis]|uniref:BHLH domain-containing protein n=1 Tax=Nyssa sinensis TaxID=561372 RepID=A0A5J5B5M7_9ASTE|nr:hypothetical protein F0562_027575 [Nyssa sinensis]